MLTLKRSQAVLDSRIDRCATLKGIVKVPPYAQNNWLSSLQLRLLLICEFPFAGDRACQLGALSNSLLLVQPGYGNTDELNQEFHLIKLFRHADSYSYLLLTYSTRLMRNKFPRVVFPQAGRGHWASRLPYYFCDMCELNPKHRSET